MPTDFLRCYISKFLNFDKCMPLLKWISSLNFVYGKNIKVEKNGKNICNSMLLWLLHSSIFLVSYHNISLLYVSTGSNKRFQNYLKLTLLHHVFFYLIGFKHCLVVCGIKVQYLIGKEMFYKFETTFDHKICLDSSQSLDHI